MGRSIKSNAGAFIGTLIGGFGLGTLGTPIAVWFAPEGGTRRILIVVWIIQACSALVMIVLNQCRMKRH